MPKLDNPVVLVGGLIALYLVWRGYQGAHEVVTKYANPANQDNIINQGVTALGNAVTGKSNYQLGVHLYNTVDSIKDALPFVDSDREKQLKIENQTRELLRSQNMYNDLPEIF